MPLRSKAIDRKTGARGLRSILENLLLDTMYDIPDMDDVEEVVINAEVVKEGQKPLLVRSDKKKPKKSAKEDEKEARNGLIFGPQFPFFSEFVKVLGDIIRLKVFHF
jgi:hypothetical protein